MMSNDTINEGHYLEFIDRLHVVSCMIDEHLLGHPLTTVEKKAKKRISKALDLIQDTYQEIGSKMTI